MKKRIVLILVLALCLPLTACGGSSETIIGQWHSILSERSVITFNKDGTGDINGNASSDFTWTYREEEKLIVIDTSQSITLPLDNDGRFDYFELDGVRYYRSEEHTEAELSYIHLMRQEEIGKIVNGMTKIELNTKYAYTDGLYITFTDVILSTDKTQLMLEAEFTNSGDTAIIVSDLKIPYRSHYYRPDGFPAFHATMRWYVIDASDSVDAEYKDLVVSPGTTAAGYTIANIVNGIPEILEVYKKFYGVLCFDFGNGYYIDLSAYIH